MSGATKQPIRRSNSATPGGVEPNPDVPSLKVVVVGDYGVGKTSLIRQLTQRQFLVHTGTTIGVEFKEQRFPDAVLQIWDIAGQQYMSSMTKQYYRWASAAIVCVDISKESTFDVALDWRRDVLEKVGCAAVATATSGASSMSPSPQRGGGNASSSSSPVRGGAGGGATSSSVIPTVADDHTIPIFLFVNKSDLLSQTSHSAESLQKFALENGFTEMILTSAKDYQNVFQAFQHVATFVVDSQDAQGIEGTKNVAGSTVNLNALRRSVRAGNDGEKTKKKGCCD
ncbi:rab30 GTP-binding protein, putative [Bodo saltans]|uniref:Rab30 GTP-binding protein, putative n=1 Tax=Bodo saltans TaxID=75058 RepID=A0A0S4KKR8_BODSA|nr:rab30 GTP-binding protein, putative [Bodo saltans]|eukprot:CUI14106.1 rab30 GTP-binding protein, putative [Bodo saltans]